MATYSQTTTTISNTGNGTFTVPCGVTSLTVEVWGAGGAGGGSDNNNAGGGAGGGSGAYVKGTYTVTAGQTITYFVGAGGTGYNGSDGTNGEDSTISTFSITAGGGTGGEQNRYSTPGTGGIASGGNITNTNGYSGTSGNNSTGGDGANAPNGGNGGDGRSNNNGYNGNAPGGAGGGGEGWGNNSSRGGHGGDGRIVFTYTAPLSSYCTPSFDNARAITNVTFAGINNTVSSYNPSEYQSYCQEASVTTGSAYEISVTSSANNYNNYYITVYIDWNQNNIFEESERKNLGHVWYSGTRTANIAVPSSALAGTTAMRVIHHEDGYINNACSNSYYRDGQAQDYLVNVSTLPCTTPTAQPTNLSLNSYGTGEISGNFSAASPASDSYLIMYSTSSTTPSITNGTTYNVGSTYGGYTVAANNGNTSFNLTSLNIGQTYYFYIFSNNSNCIGGPLYNTSNPLTGNIQLSVSYCTPNINNPGNIYFEQVNFIGTLNDTNNSSTYSYLPSGYQDFTNLSNPSIQAQGQGVNIFLELNNLGAVYAWVDWNLDGDFNDSGERVYSTNGTGIYSTTFGFVIPDTASPGTYTLRLRSGGSSSSCDNDNTGEVEDYSFVVIESCSATITSITTAINCGEGSATLGATGSSGTTEYRWYDALTGGNLVGTTSNTTWNSPSITETTSFYVTAFNGFCESLERTEVKATVRPVPSLTTNPENPVICGEDAVIELSAGGELEEVILIDENFETGSLNTFSYQQLGSTSSGAVWQVRESPYIPDEQVWFPAISSGFSGNHFAMSNSDLGGSTSVNNAIASSSVNTNGFINLNFSFDIYYSNYSTSNSSDLVRVEVSTNNGGNWTTLETYNSDLGVGSNFATMTYDLSSYIGYNQFRVRFRYIAGWNDGVAIDNILLYGNKPLSTSFNWSGATVDAYLDAACTIPYIEGTDTSTTVYIKPTLDQLETESYTFTISAALSNGCIASKDVTVTNRTKIWQGLTEEWADPNNWHPYGVPSDINCVIIKDDPFNSYIPDGFSGDALNFKVKNGGEFVIESGGSLTVQDEIIVEDNGNFLIEDNASLIQVSDVANTGIITQQRKVNISKYDYVYWSTPVANFDLNDLSPDTPGSLMWKWLPSVGNNFGNWINTTENMVNGKGYSVRAPMNYPINTDIEFQVDFVGVPNNGTITTTIERGNYVGLSYLNILNGILVTTYDDNWNLIGNPYPSAISTSAFLAANTNIEGAVHLWTHGNDPNTNTGNPFYDNFNSNYTINDYLTFNGTGVISGLLGFNGYIAAGQGFFVKMDDGLAATQNVVFTNDMRSATYANNEFFKENNAENSKNFNATNPLPEGRFWLDLYAESNQFTNRILIGYVNGATDAKDRIYDAYADENSDQNFYSIINSENILIQGKALPFLDTDMVPLGVKVPGAGNYTIAIHEVDGLFADGTQTSIYVEDTYLNITHDLYVSPYTFTANQAARFDDRFIIKYSSLPLQTDTFIDANSIKVVTANNQIKVVSSEQPIKLVTVYDLNGRKVLTVDGANNLTCAFNLKKNFASLVLQIETTEGGSVTKKVIH
ncbi:hypothetical protein Y10_00320 [Neptunitalea sp. Y10]|uniref:Ig-like domain-containing protein n=1 Tax=Neptunitalea lumnitzerae TaxID=2965509 RepID=A0ABQ5ME65_9FLAO|nr:hypothetical protein Y10_00320 [Neptunitalea sp. Y10]